MVKGDPPGSTPSPYIRGTPHEAPCNVFIDRVLKKTPKLRVLKLNGFLIFAPAYDFAMGDSTVNPFASTPLLERLDYACWCPRVYGFEYWSGLVR